MKWRGDADIEKEGPGGGGGGNFSPAPRGFYTIQVADIEDAEAKSGRPMVKLTCEIADEGEHFGKKVWMNITCIPKGEKGHGIMLHSLHAFGVELEGGPFELDTSALQGQQANVLLGVEPYDKVHQGRTYHNERNVVEELYTEKHPQPKELPPEKEKKETPAAAAKPAASGVKMSGAKVPAAIAKAFPGSKMKDEVPF